MQMKLPEYLANTAARFATDDGLVITPASVRFPPRTSSRPVPMTIALPAVCLSSRVSFSRRWVFHVLHPRTRRFLEQRRAAARQYWSIAGISRKVSDEDGFTPRSLPAGFLGQLVERRSRRDETADVDVSTPVTLRTIVLAPRTVKCRASCRRSGEPRGRRSTG